MAKFDFKKLALDHGEKAVFGLFVLIALLALVRTNWRPYSGTPGQITEKIKSGKQTLMANVWPEEEVQKYAISKQAAPANIVYQRLRQQISPAPVEASTRLVANPLGGSEPVEEPVLLAPQDLIAGSARVFLNQIDETQLADATQPEAPMAEAEVEDDSDRPDELRRNDNTMAANDGMFGAVGSYDTVVDPTMIGFEDPALMDDMMSEGPSRPELNGEGRHFISVRAVFPLREQITKYAEAINSSFHVAAAHFDIRNFELQRQIAQPGDDPWSGPWEPVDLKVAADILEKAVAFDAEVVNSMVTNAVITMPLPMRISGRWAKQATHPRIERFELSPSEIAREAEMQRRLLAQAIKQKKEMDANTIKRGGFAPFVLDARQLNQDMLNVSMFGGGGGAFMNPGMMGEMTMPGVRGRTTRGAAGNVDPLQKLIEDMAAGATNKTEEEKRIREWIQSMVSAEGELLLFRYLDFDVEPGKTYRYRVRFELANPNYGRRLAEAGGLQAVVEGETRLTPWSTPSDPQTVEDDVKYFVKNVDEKFGRVLPTVKFDMFEWSPEHGTFVNDLVEVRLGQQFAQEVETTVIDPAKNFNETKPFTFTSTDYVVDALDAIEIDEQFHETADPAKSVKLPVGSRGTIPHAPKVLVSDSDLQLAYHNPALSAAEYKRMKTYMEMQAELFEYLKAPETTTDPTLVELGLASEAEMTGIDSDLLGPQSTLRRSRRRGRTP